MSYLLNFVWPRSCRWWSSMNTVRHLWTRYILDSAHQNRHQRTRWVGWAGRCCFPAFVASNVLSTCQRSWILCWSVNGTGVLIMLKLVLIRLFKNSSAGDGKVSLTRAWWYVVMAFVVSVSPAFFFRIFSMVPTALWLWYGLDVIFTMSSWLQKLRNLPDLKQGPLCKLIFSASPNFLKMLFSTFVTASLVLLSRMS